MSFQIYSSKALYSDREIADEWVKANVHVAPVFKKGDRHTASNYRPISPVLDFERFEVRASRAPT